MPRCTAGRSPPTRPSRTPTRTTCACSTGPCSRSTPPPCASASPDTTCSTSPSRTCCPSSAASQSDVEFEMLLGMAEGQARGRAGGRRRAAALHAGRAPAGVRRRDQLPGAPPRGERQPGQLHVGGVRTRGRPAPDGAGAEPVPRLAGDSSTTRCRRRTARRTARAGTAPAADAPAFHNTSDTDPALPANRAWGRRLIDASAARRSAPTSSRRPASTTTPTLEAVIASAVEAGKAWAALGGAGRGEILRRAATRAGGQPRRPDRGHGQRDRQDHRRGRPRGHRGDRLRELLRLSGPGTRRRRRRPVHAVRADRRDAAVELPGRHPRRIHPRRAGGRAARSSSSRPSWRSAPAR